MQEHIIATEHIYRGKIVTLNLHTVRLPDDSEGLREQIEHPGAVAVVAIETIEDVPHMLLVRQYRLPVEAVTYELPAGILEADEDPAVAAARELREETGRKPLDLQPMGGLHTAPGYTTEYIHLFYATQFEHAPLPQDDGEFVTVEQVSLQEALAMIDDGRITEAKTICGVLKIARRLGV